MLANKMKQITEKHAEEAIQTSPLFVNARNGMHSQRNIENLLRNLRYMFSNSVVHMGRAHDLAMNAGDVELADYYAESASEEDGHDQWAVDDLNELKAEVGDSSLVSLNIKKLMEFVNTVVETDPVYYLSYKVFAEYFAVLTIPVFINDVERHCGISRTALSSLDKHGEADKEHALEGFEIIDRLAEGKVDEKAFLRIEETAFEFFKKFWIEVSNSNLELAEGQPLS